MLQKSLSNARKWQRQMEGLELPGTSGKSRVQISKMKTRQRIVKV